jgi:hypothetical protein
MNAADVLTTAHEGWARQSDGPPWADLGEWLVAALLAHGEQGVAILPDGTMWALTAFVVDGVTEKYCRLVPLSAEAGDTASGRLISRCHRIGGELEITDLSAEAGDTDG